MTSTVNGKSTIKRGVHVILVSLLADQLSGQFLIFLGRPKKIDPPQRPDKFFFVHALDLFCPVQILESDQFSKKTGQKIQESGQKKIVKSQRPDDFFLSTLFTFFCPVSDQRVTNFQTKIEKNFNRVAKKKEKLTGQLVGQRD